MKPKKKYLKRIDIKWCSLAVKVSRVKAPDDWLEKRVRNSLLTYFNCRQGLKWILGQIKGIRRELLNCLIDEFKPRYGRTQKFRQLVEKLNFL